MSGIYRDKNGNILIDFQKGLGNISNYLILIADLNDAYDQVKNNITVPLTKNQALAIASFVNDIGPENFISSKVLTELNKGEYQNVPRAMAEWVADGDTRRSELVARRAYEGELFQMPDQVSIRVANGNDRLNFLQQAEALRTARREYLNKLNQ